MADRGVICVFAKPPVPGKVKTRLAAGVGEAKAAALARAFLRDTWAVASSVAGARPILATTESSADDFGLPEVPEIWVQGDGDLGNRIERIARRGLTEAAFVIAIGADSPGMPARLLSRAVDILAEKDAVLGPAEDGGFYLIGLRICPWALFDGLPWSAPTTFAAMRERLDARALSQGVLEPWFDIDEPEDLDRLQSMILRGEVAARETARLLTSDRGGGMCRST